MSRHSLAAPVGSVVGVRRRHRWVLVPAGVAALSAALIVTIMVGPRMCGTIYPAPPSCFAGQFDSALTGGIIGVLVAGMVVIALGAIAPRMRSAIVTVGATLIISATVVLVVVRVALFGPIG